MDTSLKVGFSPRTRETRLRLFAAKTPLLAYSPLTTELKCEFLAKILLEKDPVHACHHHLAHQCRSRGMPEGPNYTYPALSDVVSSVLHQKFCTLEESGKGCSGCQWFRQGLAALAELPLNIRRTLKSLQIAIVSGICDKNHYSCWNVMLSKKVIRNIVYPTLPEKKKYIYPTEKTEIFLAHPHC